MTTITIGAPVRDPFYRYTWQGRDLPSWSTLRATAGIKAQIHGWALGGMVDAAVIMGPTIVAAAVTNDAAALQWVKARLRDAATDARDSAAKLGTKVHEAVEHGLTPELAPSDIAGKLAAFQDWLAVSGAAVLAQEYQVYNLTAGYGGTVDLLVLLPDGSVWVVDLKTGKSLWGEHALQLMGYGCAEFVGREDVIDEAITAFHRSARGVAVLHLQDSGWEFRSLRADGETWQAFEGLLRFAVWQHAHDSIDDVTIGKRSSKR